MIVLVMPYGECDTLFYNKNITGVRTLASSNDLRGWPEPTIIRDWQDTGPLSHEELKYLTNASDLLVPMSEEAILPCALTGRSVHSWITALALTDRVIQRRCLDHLGVNPEWRVIPKVSKVLRHASSIKSSGVAISKGDSDWGLEEEFIKGEHVEVSLWMRNRKITHLASLRQIWDEPGGTIINYELIASDYNQVLSIAGEVVHALGISDGFVCAEFIIEDSSPSRQQKPKLIEVNGRLGWEPYSRYIDVFPVKPLSVFISKTQNVNL